MKYWEKTKMETEKALDRLVEEFDVLPEKIEKTEVAEEDRIFMDKIEDRLVALGFPAHLHTGITMVLSSWFSQHAMETDEVKEMALTEDPSEVLAYVATSFMSHFLRRIGIEENDDRVSEIMDRTLLHLCGNEDEEECE